MTETYFSILCQVYLEGFSIVLEASRRHSEKDVLAVDGLSLFLLAFL